MIPESRITSSDPTRRVATRDDRRRARQIRIHWLINLRWLAVMGQLVTMLIVPPGAPPCSVENEFLLTWNSWMAFWLMEDRTLPEL